MQDQLLQLQQLVQQMEGKGQQIPPEAQQILQAHQDLVMSAQRINNSSSTTTTIGDSHAGPSSRTLQQQQLLAQQQQEERGSESPQNPPRPQLSLQEQQQQLDWESIVDFPHGSLRLLGSCKAPWMDSDPEWVTEKAYSRAEYVGGVWMRLPLTLASVMECSIQLQEEEHRVFEQTEEFLEVTFQVGVTACALYIVLLLVGSWFVVAADHKMLRDEDELSAGSVSNAHTYSMMAETQARVCLLYTCVVCLQAAQQREQVLAAKRVKRAAKRQLEYVQQLLLNPGQQPQSDTTKQSQEDKALKAQQREQKRIEHEARLAAEAAAKVEQEQKRAEALARLRASQATSVRPALQRPALSRPAVRPPPPLQSPAQPPQSF